jgi:hypothetical protein
MKIIKMDNFDLKKYLVENKITTQSRLNEDEEQIQILDNVEHEKSGIKVTLYSNGAVQYCKDDKMIDAIKKSNQYEAKALFDKIKKYLEENPEEELDTSKIYKGAGVAYSIGTTYSINTKRSDECGMKGIQSISWAR